MSLRKFILRYLKKRRMERELQLLAQTLSTRAEWPNERWRGLTINHYPDEYARKSDRAFEVKR